MSFGINFAERRQNADDDEITFRSRASARIQEGCSQTAASAILWSILNFNPKSTIIHENNFLRVMFASFLPREKS